jgi:hypothetical protein
MTPAIIIAIIQALPPAITALTGLFTLITSALEQQHASGQISADEWTAIHNQISALQKQLVSGGSDVESTSRELP